MVKEREEATAADILAALVTGDAEYGMTAAAVQRSHRFPYWVWVQIENLAKIGKIPTSLVINQLIEAGLEAVKEKLPENTVSEMRIDRKGVGERRTVGYRVDTKKSRRKKP